MKRYVKPQIPEDPEWVSVNYGCPRKEVRVVRVRLLGGSLLYASYNNRERRWTRFPEGTPLNNVVSWKLIPDSFQDAEQEPTKEP